MFRHSLTWRCPQCNHKTGKSYTMPTRNLDLTGGEICAGQVVSHAPTEMMWSAHEVVPIGGLVGPSTWPERPSFNELITSAGMSETVRRLHTPKPNPALIKAKEQAEIAQKVIVGDVIQLVSKDGAVLQGEVLAVRRNFGKPVQVRLKGFDHVGGKSGGHHVYWPLKKYDVEILVESYRVTEEDRLVCVIGGYSEDAFKTMTEARRLQLRNSYGAKARRAAQILKGEGG